MHHGAVSSLSFLHFVLNVRSVLCRAELGPATSEPAAAAPENIALHRAAYQSTSANGPAHLGFSANLLTVATDTVPMQAVGSAAGIDGMAAQCAPCSTRSWSASFSTALPATSLLLPSPVSYFRALGMLHLLLPNLKPMRLEMVK
jgi:hypothetical protein